jgi:hypothetical protein
MRPRNLAVLPDTVEQVLHFAREMEGAHVE